MSITSGGTIFFSEKAGVDRPTISFRLNVVMTPNLIPRSAVEDTDISLQEVTAHQKHASLTGRMEHYYFHTQNTHHANFLACTDYIFCIYSIS